MSRISKKISRIARAYKEFQEKIKKYYILLFKKNNCIQNYQIMKENKYN